MRIVVIGGTGNLGTHTLRALASDPSVDALLGVARRTPELEIDKTEWASADVAKDDLVPLLRGADVVLHLAWLFQPTHDPQITWEANVVGTGRVLRAVADAGVPALICASSVGAYSPGPKDRKVAEDWPTHGWSPAAYSREKAYVERMLDRFEAEHPDRRVVRMRPGFIFTTDTATEQRRLFAGPFLPRTLVRPELIPIVPDIPGMRFQSLHSEDAGAAFQRAAVSDVRGAFNLAADPVVDPDLLATIFNARTVRVPAFAARAALSAAWHLHLLPASPDLLDLALRVPLMDTTRATTELGWSPQYTSRDALEAFLTGLRTGADAATPALSATSSGPARATEIRSGIGERP
jgi:UDP-glucose 4-epimerase